MKTRLPIVALLILAPFARAEIVIDDFSQNPEGKSNQMVTAPHAKHFVANVPQTGLDPKKTIGGSRVLAVNANKLGAKRVSANVNARSKVWLVGYPPGSSAFAFVSWSGGKGERRQLRVNLAEGGNDRITVEVKSAPDFGELSLVLYAGRDFGKQTLPVKGKGTYEFPFKDFEGGARKITPARIDGIGIELKVKDAPKGASFEIDRVVARKGPAAAR